MIKNFNDISNMLLVKRINFTLLQINLSDSCFNKLPILFVDRELP
jgi:hypothetical protein